MKINSEYFEEPIECTECDRETNRLFWLEPEQKKLGMCGDCFAERLFMNNYEIGMNEQKHIS